MILAYNNSYKLPNGLNFMEFHQYPVSKYEKILNRLRAIKDKSYVARLHFNQLERLERGGEAFVDFDMHVCLEDAICLASAERLLKEWKRAA